MSAMIDLKEIFLPLSGFKRAEILSEKYRVSNYGKVYDVINHRLCTLSLCGDPQYYYLTLTHKDVRKTVRVNRLVALSFIPNPKNLPIVDHIDRDRLNNYVENLRWVTKSKNQLNSDRVDNKGDNSNVKQGKVDFKGVSKNNSVFCKGVYYGRCETKEIAAKIFDTIARKEFTTPYLNFPNEEFCAYKDINKYLSKQKIQRHICKNLIDRIIYKWKYEYMTQAKLSEIYNIPAYKISGIVRGIQKKKKKPEWKISKEWVRNYYTKKCVQQKYLSGVHSRKKLGELFGIPLSTVDSWLKGFPCLGRKKSLAERLQKEIYSVYKTGARQCDVIKLYEKEGLTRSMMSNIRDKYDNENL